MKIVLGQIVSVSSKTALIFATDGVMEQVITLASVPNNLIAGSTFLMDFDTKTLLQEAGAEIAQELTASGAVTPGVECVQLNHTTVAIAATIADASKHPGIFHAKATTEPGAGQDHTITITTGTWDGTNKVATFADIKDALTVYFDKAGNGTILNNTGTVALS
jgi:hypothetical protein